MRYLIAVIIFAVLHLVQAIYVAGQPETLGCDTVRDLLGWQRCRTLEHKPIWPLGWGCGHGDAHSYLVQGPAARALVCCGAFLKGCTIRSEVSR